jgi:hypothetical protein
MPDHFAAFFYFGRLDIGQKTVYRVSLGVTDTMAELPGFLAIIAFHEIDALL